MKKKIALLSALMVATVALSSYAVFKAYGWGYVRAVGPAVTRLTWSPDDVRSLSVYNAGTSTLFAAVNCTTTQFTNQMALTNGIPVPGGASYTFQPPAEVSGFRFKSLCMQLLVATTNTAYVAGF